MQFLTCDTDEPAVTCEGDYVWSGSSGPHMLQTTSKKGQNTLVSWTPETIPVRVTYFLQSLQSQPLTLFPPCVLVVIWNPGDQSRAAEVLVSAARGTNPCVTICNIIKKSVLCFIQPIRANQCEPSVWWEGGEGGLRGCWGPGRVCYSSVFRGPALCLDCCVWIKQIGLHLTL